MLVGKFHQGNNDWGENHIDKVFHLTLVNKSGSTRISESVHIQEAVDMGEKKVVLETSSHQTAAVRFYNKTGWIEVKTITDKNFRIGLII